MKTTIELPDPLMDEVKSLAAREQRKLGDVVADLVRAGLDSRISSLTPTNVPTDPEQWMRAWLALADDVMQDAPDGPNARTLLDEERNRLERR